MQVLLAYFLALLNAISLTSLARWLASMFNPWIIIESEF